MPLMELAEYLSSGEQDNGACSDCSVNTNLVVSITIPTALVVICFNVYDSWNNLFHEDKNGLFLICFHTYSIQPPYMDQDHTALLMNSLNYSLMNE